jgi:molecular chaperone DnaJ
MSQRDYYQVLNVSKQASESELKKAYRQLAMKHHPDKNPGDHTAEEKFKEAAEAYEILKDPEKRQIYNQYGHEGLKGRGFNGFSGFDDISSSFGDIFQDFFGGGGERREQTGADLRLDITISFTEAAFGTEKKVDITKQGNCNSCRGSGAKTGTSPKTCSTCRGTGQVVRTQGFFNMASPCPTCQGQGQVIEHPCSTCYGEGRVPEKKSINATIPAGVNDGSKLRLRGEGEAGPPGLQPGDLYIFIRVAPDEIFQRQEYDVYCRLNLTFSQAALGAEIEVPLLNDETKVIKIKAGTQSGEMMRITGAGIPHVRGNGRGDQNIQMMVETPKKLNKKQKEIFQELAEIEGNPIKETLKGFFQKLKL